MFVFRPGALGQGAAHVRRLRSRAGGRRRARAAPVRPRVARIPNVTAIDVRDVIARIQAVVDNVVLAISIVGGIALPAAC